MKNNLKSLFVNEWVWRLFFVLQIGGIISVIYLATTNDDHWRLLPYTAWNNELTWNFFDSFFWTIHNENWFATAFLLGPFLLSKACDWIFSAKKKKPSEVDWKQN